MPDLHHLKVIKSGTGISIGLFDFNYPDKNLDFELSRITELGNSQKLELEYCLDHHSITNGKFLEQFRIQNVQFAGSCHTLLYSYFEESVVDFLRLKLPMLLHIAALVIRADCQGFDKVQENLR